MSFIDNFLCELMEGIGKGMKVMIKCYKNQIELTISKKN